MKNKTLTSLFISLLLVLLIYPSLPAQTKAKEIQELLTGYHESGFLNGAVLVAYKGEVIFKAGFGYADVEQEIPNTPDTKFRIASTTKQFTAALTLTLVEDGLLELDGMISDYLPDYPVPQGQKIIIHHLLSHTSGIPSYTTPEFMESEVQNPHPPDSLVALFSDLDLQFEPGSQWAYSNSGFVLLGAIIEEVTGKSYEEALQERVLKPLNLKNTGYNHNSIKLSHSAKGYVKTSEGLKKAPYLHSSVPFSAGMLYSTVEDLYRWDQALYDNGPFQKPETKTLFLSPHIALPPQLSAEAGLPTHYGYGIFTGKVNIEGDSIRVTEHGGNIFGFTSGFWRMPDEQNTIIILDNSSNSKIREIGEALKAILYSNTQK